MNNTSNTLSKNIVPTKKFFNKFEAVICQAAIFCFVYLAIKYAFPFFYPYYANSAFTIKTETSRTIISIIGLVFLWFSLLKERKLFEENKRISFIAIIVVNLWYFLPGMFMNILYICQLEYVVIYTVFCVILNILIMFGSKNKVTTPKIRRVSFKIQENKILNNDDVCIVIAAVILIASLFLNGFSINITNLFDNSDIYQTRFENRIFNSGYLYYVWYFVVCGSCIIPTWTIISLEKKQFLRAAFYTLCICSFYSVSCNRQFLFLHAFVFAFYFLRKKDNAVLYVTLVMWLLTYLEIFYLKEATVGDIVRRLSVVPNVNANFHVDYFLKFEPDALRQAWNFYLSRIGISSPYSESIAATIGNTYYGYVINANTGLVGGTFANYGYFSLIIGPVLYAVALKILDKFFIGIENKSVYFVTAVVLAFNFTNSETFLEQIIVPSWILLYYLSLWILPTIKSFNKPLLERVKE